MDKLRVMTFRKWPVKALETTALLWVIGMTGCASRLATASGGAAEPVIQATPVVITPHHAGDVAEMFERAHALLSKGRTTEAATLFDTVAEADASGPLASAAIYNAGLAWELGGQREKALARFKDALRQARGNDDIGTLAAIRATRLLGMAENWNEVLQVAETLLARKHLRDVERLEAVGAKALALVELGELELAAKHVAQGRDLIDVLGLGGGGRLPTAVAQIQFVLGELRRLRSEQIVFVPMPPSFPDVLERRCQGLLDAQNAYTDAMRSLDPHWAAMSGYRVGQLYQRLHADILAITPPPQANTNEKRQLFEGAMRLRFRILLEKGLKMMDHTVSMGERSGEAGAWVARAREARDELLRSLAEEKEALARLPYSEQDLQRALDDLEKKSRPKS